MKRNLIIIGIILLLDQVSKVWIKTSLMLGEEIPVFSWFIIHFTENPGMAFGLEWGGNTGKYILTLFRLVAAFLIFFWLKSLAVERVKTAAQVAVSLIFAGAVGNLIDSLFYGIIFDHSLGQVATFFPESGGYSGLFLGKVVDMLYFPLIQGNFPQWLPFWGGEHFIFFRPIFNIADAAITVGVVLLILNQKHVFKK